MIPNIFRLLDLNQSEIVKSNALVAINILLMTQCPALTNHLEDYAKHILSMWVDNSPLVKWRIVQGFNAILELKVGIILQLFDQVSELTIAALGERDQKIALAATEFWSGIVLDRCETPEEEQAKKNMIFSKLKVLMG